MRVLGLSLLLTLGCQLSYPYPELTPEVGRAQCADGVDQDLDGKVDCLDPDCAGVCAESGLARCEDGVDQDDDGLVDAVDPDCWPWIRFEVDACVSSVNPATEHPISDPAIWAGTGQTTEHTGEDGVSFPVQEAALGDYFVSMAATAGAVEGMSLEAELMLPEGGDLSFGMIPAADEVRSPPRLEQHPGGLMLQLGLDYTVLPERISVEGPWVVIRYGGRDAAHDAFVDRLPAAALAPNQWSTVRVRIADGVVEVALNDGEPLAFVRAASATAPTTPSPTPAAWTEGRPLRFVWGSGGATPARVRALRWTRPRHDPCGYHVPQLDDRVVGAATDPAGHLCVLRWSAAERRTRSTRFEGPEQGELGEGFRTPFLDPVEGALTWSEADDAFVGMVLLSPFPDQVSTALLVRSSDCNQWTVAPSGLDAELLELMADDGVAYEVLPTGVHRAHLPLKGYTTLLAESPDGAEGSFRWVSGGLRPRPPTAADREGLEVIRGHRVSLSTDIDGSLKLWVGLPNRGWEPSTEPFVEPSRKLGTFEAEGLARGDFFPNLEAREGWLLHTGPDPEGPTAIRRVRW